MGCVMPTSGLHRVQAALGLIYLCAGSAKLLGADIMVEAFDVTGLGQSLRIAVGLLEIGGGLCLFVPRATIYAAMVLGCTILGILGATVGHMAQVGIEQQPYAGSQRITTKAVPAVIQKDSFTAAIWNVPGKITRRWGIEG